MDVAPFELNDTRKIIEISPRSKFHLASSIVSVIAQNADFGTPLLYVMKSFKLPYYRWLLNAKAKKKGRPDHSGGLSNSVALNFFPTKPRPLAPYAAEALR
jgi:hypothetical protein